ncbi:uncharacterized protein A1O9_05497 [Exophiala aquamarina CBS 119918]|uniref:Major facilitator superfamily (MFS) profile domain-containing protein n=1 Tax=Exophiala aquamarina CBS 119918 TaxID=1182545 RepID=A0A072PBT1_9EURO|nr:uncharacterized protein A1O9_05497 [Exophiala aquamarina CBS 119918]KEF57579.1 hypothetical protein A1O9_05497 [Exophiala aquamarina CBS 119918]
MSAPEQDAEKARHVEMVDSIPAQDDDVSYAEGRKIVHKIDRRLVTSLGLMFAISLMDRTNLASANISGMSHDLTRIVYCHHNFLCSLYRLPVAKRCSCPENRSTPLFAGGNFLWGIVMLCMGFLHHWGELLGLRAIVGIFEAGLFPGALFLLQMWYIRYDVHKRYASFYLISIVGSSLSGVLAYAFMQMGGVGGYLGWRYIFILEGVLTCLTAIVGAFLIVDFPEKAQNSRAFLKPHELAYVIRLLGKDRSDAHDTAFSLAISSNPAWMLRSGFSGSSFFAFFLPIILNVKMGFDVGISQVLSTPPYFFAAIVMCVEAWIGDKYHVRSPIIVCNALLAICELCLQAWTETAGVQDLGAFLVIGSANSSVPTVMAWQANNIRGQWKRPFSSASLITLGGLGGIVGALVFRSEDAPQYLPGIYASLT